MNTMYAAVARRAREIGTLRVLGFSRGSILFSFFVESVLLAFLGGVLGCVLVLPLNGITTADRRLTFQRDGIRFPGDARRSWPRESLLPLCWAPSAVCSRRAWRRKRRS